MAISESRQLPISLDRIASILQINPAHFNQTYGGENAYGFCDSCTDLWCQYVYQSMNGLSRENLAEQIFTVTEMLEGILGHPIYPKKKMKRFSAGRGSITSLSHAGVASIVSCSCSANALRNRFFIDEHVRGHRFTKWTSATASVTYEDLNADTVKENAVVVGLVPNSIDNSQIGLFFSGYLGDTGKQICDFTIKSIQPSLLSSGKNVVTIHVPTYKLVKPTLWLDGGTYNNNTINGCACLALDFSNPANLVTQVELGWIEWDDSKPLVKFITKTNCSSCGGCGCENCDTCKFEGCYADTGLAVMPIPASYDEDCEEWVEDTECSIGDVLAVEITYWDCYGMNDIETPTAQPFIHPVIQRVIAYAAFARMQFGNLDCECNRAVAWRELWRELDVMNTGETRVLDFYRLQNLFGNRRGDFMAHDLLKTLTGGVYAKSGSI